MIERIMTMTSLKTEAAKVLFGKIQNLANDEALEAAFDLAPDLTASEQIKELTKILRDGQRANDEWNRERMFF